VETELTLGEGTFQSGDELAPKRRLGNSQRNSFDYVRVEACEISQGMGSLFPK
jgi:hypothetical protein